MLFVVGYVKADDEGYFNGPVGVYDREELANAAANKKWEQLKENNEEIVSDAELDEEGMAEADDDREIESLSDNKIAVEIDTVDDKVELLGYFKGKGWLGAWWNDLKINEEI